MICNEDNAIQLLQTEACSKGIGLITAKSENKTVMSVNIWEYLQDEIDNIKINVDQITTVALYGFIQQRNTSKQQLQKNIEDLMLRAIR